MSEPIKVLILEDVPSDAELMQRELRKAGLQFNAVLTDTKEGFVEQLETFRPDIILSDYGLPSFDALGALDIVREKSPATPFIIISGSIGEDLAVEALKRGASDYFLKDRISKLGSAVERALREAKEHKNLRQAQAEIIRHNQSLELLYQCSLDLALLPEGTSVGDILTEWLKKLSGGYAVTFGEYDRISKEIALKRILIEPGALARIEAAVGKRLLDLRSPISPETYRLMMAEQVGVRASLHDISFGAVPKLVSATVGVMLGIDRYVAVVYQTEGTLYGTSVIALKKGQPEPDHAMLKAFGALGAVSLRRSQAEAKLQTAHEQLQAGYQEIEANNQELQAAEEELRKQNEELMASEEELKANEEELEKQLGEIERSRDELRESEAKFRALFENMAAASCLDEVIYQNGKAVDYRIIDVNPSFEQIIGVTRMETIGKRASELYGGEIPFFDIYAGVAETGQPASFEAYFAPAKKHLHITVSCPGKGRFSTVFTDITERMRAEAERLLASQRWQTTFDAISDIVCVISKNHEFIAVNDAGVRTMGLPREQIVGRKCFELVHQTDAPITACPCSKTLETGIAEFSEIEQAGRFYSLHAWPIKNAEGETESFVHIVRDITARKRAEKIVQSLSSRQEAMLEAIPEIIMEVDTGKRYTWANQVGLQFFGDDVIGKEAAHYFEGEQNTYETVKPLFNGFENVIYVESWQRRWDGQKRLLAWWCRTLKNERGEATGALSSAQDITERRENEEKIKVQLAELLRWQGAMLDREDRMIELKSEVNALLAQTGQPKKYGGG